MNKNICSIIAALYFCCNTQASSGLPFPFGEIIMTGLIFEICQQCEIMELEKKKKKEKKQNTRRATYWGNFVLGIVSQAFLFQADFLRTKSALLRQTVDFNDIKEELCETFASFIRGHISVH